MFDVSVFKRAWRDTLAAFSLSLGTVVRSLLGAMAFFLLLFWGRGEERALDEITDYFLYLVAIAGGAFLPTFLWNLWLAPYRIMQERLDAVDNSKLPDFAGMQEIDISDYKHHKNILLYEAACLWVDIKPHFPLKHPRAEAKLSLLKSAIRNGELVCNSLAGLSLLAHVLTGEKPRSPDDDQQVLLVELRRYADVLGEVPKFLQHVHVPPQHPPSNEAAE